MRVHVWKILVSGEKRSTPVLPEAQKRGHTYALASSAQHPAENPTNACSQKRQQAMSI